MDTIKKFKKVLFNGYKKSEVDSFVKKIVSLLKKQQSLLASRDKELADSKQLIESMNQLVEDMNNKMSDLKGELETVKKEKNTVIDGYKNRVRLLEKENVALNSKIIALKTQNENMKFVYEYTARNVGDIIVAAEGVANDIIERANNTVAEPLNEQDHTYPNSDKVISINSKQREILKSSDMEVFESELSKLQDSINKSIEAVMEEIASFSVDSEKNRDIAN